VANEFTTTGNARMTVTGLLNSKTDHILSLGRLQLQTCELSRWDNEYLGWHEVWLIVCADIDDWPV
jgi:hypothetical protein